MAWEREWTNGVLYYVNFEPLYQQLCYTVTHVQQKKPPKNAVFNKIYNVGAPAQLQTFPYPTLANHFYTIKPS